MPPNLTEEKKILLRRLNMFISAALELSHYLEQEPELDEATQIKINCITTELLSAKSKMIQIL